MKKKKTVIFLVCALAAILLAGGIFLLSGDKQADTPADKFVQVLSRGDWGEMYDIMAFEQAADKDTFTKAMESGIGDIFPVDLKDNLTLNEYENGYIITDEKGDSLFFTVNEEGKIEPLFGTQYRIYAPFGSAVTLDGTDVPYNDSLRCYSAFINLPGKHTVTVGHENCESFSEDIEVDFEGGNNELKVDLKYTEEYIEQMTEVSESTLLAFVEKCSKYDYDLSSFNFYSDTEKQRIENTVYGIISDMESVDTELFTTGEIKVNSIIVDKIGGSDELLCKWDNDSNAVFVSFLLEYVYSWEFNGSAYQDSGVESQVHSPYIKMEKIDGDWYVRELYLNIRKTAK